MRDFSINIIHSLSFSSYCIFITEESLKTVIATLSSWLVLHTCLLEFDTESATSGSKSLLVARKKEWFIKTWRDKGPQFKVHKQQLQTLDLPWLHSLRLSPSQFSPNHTFSSVVHLPCSKMLNTPESVCISLLKITQMMQQSFVSFFACTTICTHDKNPKHQQPLRCWHIRKYSTHWVNPSRQCSCPSGRGTEDSHMGNLSPKHVQSVSQTCAICLPKNMCTNYLKRGTLKKKKKKKKKKTKKSGPKHTKSSKERYFLWQNTT